MKKICIIGGMNFSIISEVDGRLQEDNSVCGNIYTRFGGVAYNIASVISEYEGFQIDYMTILSRDMIGKLAESVLEEHRISYINSLYLDNWASYYSDICSRNFHYGINDMKIVDMIDQSFINTRKQKILNNDILIIDENISPDVMEFIVDNIDIPIYCEATSPLKCKRISSRINNIYAIKFNKKEFCEFYCTDDSIFEKDELILETVKNRCAELTFVTLGGKGSFCISNHKIYRCQTRNIINAVNTLQAGDSFFGGVIVKLLSGEDIPSSMEYGTLCAEKRLMANNPNNDILSDETIKKLDNISSGLKDIDTEYNICPKQNFSCLRCSGSSGRYIYDK